MDTFGIAPIPQEGLQPYTPAPVPDGIPEGDESAEGEAKVEEEHTPPTFRQETQQLMSAESVELEGDGGADSPAESAAGAVNPKKELPEVGAGEPAFAVLLEKVPHDIDETELMSMLTEKELKPEKIDLQTGPANDYAILRYMDEAQLTAVIETLEGQSMEVNEVHLGPMKFHPFPLEIEHSNACILSGLDTALNQGQLQELLKDVLFEYHVEFVHTRFGKATDYNASFALLVCDNSTEIHTIHNDLHGLIVDKCDIRVQWLSHQEQRLVEGYLAKLKRLSHSHKDAQYVALLGGVPLDVTNEELLGSLKHLGVVEADVKADANGKSFGFATIRTSDPLTNITVRQLSETPVAGVVVGVEPIVAPIVIIERRKSLVSPQKKARLCKKLRAVGQARRASLLFAKSMTKEKIKDPSKSVQVRHARHARVEERRRPPHQPALPRHPANAPRQRPHLPIFATPPTLFTAPPPATPTPEPHQGSGG